MLGLFDEVAVICVEHMVAAILDVEDLKAGLVPTRLYLLVCDLLSHLIIHGAIQLLLGISI